MKNQIATDISQSRRLLSCGVDPKTADMSVRTIKEPYGEDMAWHTPKLLTLPYDEAKTIYGDDEITPAWSLSALLELLPPQFKPSWPEFDFCLQLRRSANGKWEIAYDHIFEADSPIEACVQMIEWLTENGYPLNKIEE